MSDFNAANIPPEMKELPRWVLFTLFENSYSHRLEKLPWSVNGRMADITKPETWSSFEKASAVLQKNKNYSGLGFVLGDGIFGIDLDHVIDEDGTIQPWAEEIIRLMDTYTEYSPSGTGIHIYARGKIPSRDRKNGNVEMYDERRYFTVTGRPWGELKPLAERTREASAVHRQYLKRDHRDAPPPQAAVSKVAAGDTADLIDRAGKAKNGEKFIQLYRGNTAGYASQSQADQALCNILAFYAGGNAALVDAAFRTSALMRSKWDSRRGGTTYGEMTVAKALSSVNSRANPSAERPRQPKGDTTAPLPVDMEETEGIPGSEEDAMGSPPVDIKDDIAAEAEPDFKEEKKKNDKRIPVIKDDIKIEEKDTELFTDIRSAWENGIKKTTKETERAATGIGTLDQRLDGGIGRGIWMLGSEPSIGKTSLMLQFARSSAADGAEVLYISFEQEVSYLQAKIIAAEMTQDSGMRISPERLLKGERSGEVRDLTAQEPLFERIRFVKGEDCPNEGALLDIIGRFSAVRKPYADGRGKPCIVFIDYLQIIPFSSGAGIRAQIDDFTRRLRQLQMRTGICVFLVSSLNRMSYMGPVRLDSFKESGIIEFTGDVILGLNLRAVRSSDYMRLTEGSDKAARLEAARARRVRELEISCLKNKTGESNFTVDVDFDTESGIFTEKRS